MALVLEFIAVVTCAIFIGRWGWREAKQYIHARAAIRKILSRCVVKVSANGYANEQSCNRTSSRTS
jgi:hypothetical protein